MNIVAVPHTYEYPRKATVKVLLPICRSDCGCLDPAADAVVSCLRRHMNWLDTHDLQHDAIVWPQNCFPRDVNSEPHENVQARDDAICIYGCKTDGDIFIKDCDGQLWGQKISGVSERCTF